MFNPRVFMDISINQRPPERIVIELFADVVPKTAENFRALCVGFKNADGKHLHYKGCIFYYILKRWFAEAGDFNNHINGIESESIYGKTFPDENFLRCHSGPGTLSMVNRGRNANGSRFLLHLCYDPSFNGCNVVFGKVVEGMGILNNISELGTCTGLPSGRAEIIDCGEVPEYKMINVIGSVKPQTSSVRKEETEANPQEDNDSKFCNMYNEYILAAMMNLVHHSDDPIKSRKRSKESESPQITESGKISEDKPQSSSVVRKEESEAMLQKDNDSKKYESSDEKLEATLKNNVLVTNQHSDDPSKSRGDQSPVRKRSKKSESPQITDSGEISEDKKSNVIELNKPQSSSVRKEESEAMLQKYNDSKIYESSDEKLEATLKNNVLVTNQHSDDPSKSRYSQSPTNSPSPGENISGKLESCLGPSMGRSVSGSPSSSEKLK